MKFSILGYSVEKIMEFKLDVIEDNILNNEDRKGINNNGEGVIINI